MSHIARLRAIQSLFRSYPGLSKPAVLRDTKKAERYVSPLGMPIVLEPRGVRHNNIWVRADSLDITPLKDMAPEPHANASEAESSNNSNLFTDPLMKKVDLYQFRATSVADAKRVIDAVIDAGAAP
jgi:hypothetical protein